MMKKKEELILFLILIMMMLPVFLIISKTNIYFDLTDNREYSISEFTEDVLSEYEQPLYITWWKSEEFKSPQLEIISSLFAKLPVISTIRNPGDDEKDRLRELGFPEEQIEYERAGELTQALVFSGLEIRYLNKTVIVPFLVDPLSLEYQIVEALIRLEEGGKKTIAIFSDNSNYTIMISELTKNFNVLSVSNENPLKSIPDFLIVPDVMDFSNENLFAIDRSIQSGSPVIFLCDGLDINPQLSDYALPFESPSIIHQWLEGYGITVEESLISDRNSLSLAFVSENSQRFSNYDFWFKGSDRFDALWSSPISTRSIEGLEKKVLLKSSELSWLKETDVDLRPQFEEEADDFTGPYPIAVEVKGEFQPLFQYSEDSYKTDGTILVFGSSLSFSDVVQSSGSLGNLVYIRNEIYRLLGYDNLYNIALLSDRENKMDASGQIQPFVINLVMYPMLIISLYIILLSKRKKSRSV